jgi:hypothetical protein
MMMRIRSRPARPPSILLGRPAGRPGHRLAAANDAAAAAPSPPPPPRALEEAARLAAARLAETRRGDAALFSDPYAALLSRADGDRPQPEQQQQQQGRRGEATPAADTERAAAASSAALDAVATRYLDECLLNAAGATSVTRMARGEDYRQVVLLGVDGGDCRPFRLPWPEGTVIFLVAPPEVHERAEALLQQLRPPPPPPPPPLPPASAEGAAAAEGEEGGPEARARPPPARVPRGCLLRRVDLDTAALRRAAAGPAAAAPGDGGDDSTSTIFMDALVRAGFRGDRVSVWGLQGLQGLLGPAATTTGGGGDYGTRRRAVAALLAELSSAAAFHSLAAGELPGPLSVREGANLLAEAGLLASVEPPGGAGTREYGRGGVVVGEAAAGAASISSSDDGDQDAVWPRLFFSAQQLRPSLVQMGIYSEHVEAMEGSDEDFGTLHFS